MPCDTTTCDLASVAHGREEGLHGVLADVWIVICELAELEDTADREHHGVDQPIVWFCGMDQALRDGGLVEGIALLDAQVGGIALRLGELVGEARGCSTEGDAGMACCDGAPQGAEAATACCTEEEDCLGLEGGHCLEAVSGGYICCMIILESSKSVSLAKSISIVEDGRPFYLPCLPVLWRGLSTWDGLWVSQSSKVITIIIMDGVWMDGLIAYMEAFHGTTRGRATHTRGCEVGPAW